MRKNTLTLATALFAAFAILACQVITAEEEKPREKSFIDTHIHLYVVKDSARQEPPDRPPRGPKPGHDKGNQPRDARIRAYLEAAKNLISLMDECGVAKALVMEPPQTSEIREQVNYDHEDNLAVIKEYPDRLFLVAGGATLNPLIHGTEAAKVTEKDRAAFREEAAKLIRAGAKGFGEMAVLHIAMHEKHHYSQAPADHPLFLLLADIAAEHNLPIDIHMEAVLKEMPTPPGLDKVSLNPAKLPATIPGFESLLAHNRKANIVWQHIGWDNTGQMTVDLVRSLLAAHSNLYVALRVVDRLFDMAGNPIPNRLVDKTGKIREEWLKLIGDFPDRFMIGTDEFVGIPGVTRSMPQSFKQTWSILDQLPADLARKVGRDNAAKIYNLE